MLPSERKIACLRGQVAHSTGAKAEAVRMVIQIIDIVYVGTWIGNGVVYGPIYGNM